MGDGAARVSSEHLIDRVLQIRKTDVVGAVEQALVLIGILAELRPAVTVNDRPEAVSGAVYAEVPHSCRDMTPVREVRARLAYI